MLRKTASAFATATIILSLFTPGKVLAQAGPGELKPAELDGFVSKLYQAAFPEEFAPGISVAVVKDDQIFYLQGFGYADLEARRKVTPQTVFYIASATKPFVALMAALMQKNKSVDLSAPLSRYLPGLQLAPGLSADQITLRDLLTHTHGISNDGPVVIRTAFSGDYTKETLFQLLAKHKQESRDFRYGNIGYVVASLGLESVLKQSWKDGLQRQVLNPLKMKSTSPYVSRVPKDKLALPYFARNDYDRLFYAKADANMHAAGGLVSSAEDMARWLQVNINVGQIKGARIFPADVIEDAHRKYAEQRAEGGGITRTGYALGWNIGTYNGETVLQHNGGFSAFYAHVSFMPERKLGVVVLAHEAIIGSRLAELVAQYVYDFFLRGPDFQEKWEKRLASLPKSVKDARQKSADELTRRKARPQTLSHPLDAYAGVYVNDDLGRMEWRVINSKLVMSFGVLRSETEVFDASKDVMRVELTPGQGETVKFTFAGDRAEKAEYLGMVFTRKN
jgi:CubicO group peptidase (beta-lactamase class C family)